MGISVQSLSEQLIRVEREVAAIRRELARLQARPASDLATIVTEPQPRVKKADKQHVPEIGTPLVNAVFDRLYPQALTCATLALLEVECLR